MLLEVADLFSGLDGWGAAFRDRGHHVVSFDLDPRFGAQVVIDMNDVRALNRFDVILASPPCECFSVMTIGKNWTGGKRAYEPKTEKAKAALALAWHTFEIIERARPRWYVVENPRGMLRKVAPRPPNATTWYCQWGMPYAKPTDLWTNINGGGPFGWPACRNGGPDHARSPRGDKENSVQGSPTRQIRRRLQAGERIVGYRLRKDGSLATQGALALGTSGRDAALRSLIPYRLSLAVCLAAERDGALPSMDEVVAIERELRALPEAA